MDKPTRNKISSATQDARRLLETEFSEQLEGTFDILPDGTVEKAPGAHLDDRQRLVREKLVATLEHKRAAGKRSREAVEEYLREAAFTCLNRFAALKMLEARGLVRECVSRGEQSSGFREFGLIAPGLAVLPDRGYRLYIETLFDELSTEIKVLFDRRAPESLLWPRRQALSELLEILNRAELAGVWAEDETIGWVYQYFNSDEERRRMRKASQAPRNSHELAVRNQFFTPRYVVEFLTDNTLGRTWYEMTGGETALAERCRYLVKTDEQPLDERPRKDPRDLKVLDPACGSGHFLLYAFDLLLTIYEEAWQDEQPQVASEATGRTLRQDYPDREALLHHLPVVILERNLYGVDIDPRAAQIAALTLWMRAQRAFRDAGVQPADRPAVRRTRIVVAEPMPGDEEMVRAFASELRPPLLGDLFRRMVDEMKLAGELGTLLRVEEAIAGELQRARKEFAEQRQRGDYLPGMEPEHRQGELDFSGIDDADFFHHAEELIVGALRRFAEERANGGSVRRRLFAEDAAQGIALIDVCRTRFDVVLMNPPFGACGNAAKQRFEQSYPRTKNDLYAAFVERGIGLLWPHGLLGAITPRTGFFLSSFQKWRQEILLEETRPVVFADLGYGVMDAAKVEAAAYCLGRPHERRERATVFLRASGDDDKAAALLGMIREPEAVLGKRRFNVDPSSFESVPRSSFAYWVSDGIRQLFQALPPFEGEGRKVKQGLATADDFRFVRAWWEVRPEAILDARQRPEWRHDFAQFQAQCRLCTHEGKQWVPFAKAGEYSPYYADLHVVVNWRQDGAEIRAFADPKTGKTYSRPQNTDFYFLPGLTWPARPYQRGTFASVPPGAVFSHTGTMVFLPAPEHWATLALLNSSAFIGLLHLLMARGAGEGTDRTLKYEVGYVASVPIPRLTEETSRRLAELARAGWSMACSERSMNETSMVFCSVLPCRTPLASLLPDVADNKPLPRDPVHGMPWVNREIDNLAFSAFGVSGDDREALELSAGKHPASAMPEGLDVEYDETHSPSGDLVPDLVSWAIGCAFGRFDIRMATSDSNLPSLPDPFDPLKPCPPAMLTDDKGLPLTTAPAAYPVALPEIGILVDDPGHAEDLTGAARAVFSVVFGADAEARWNEASTILEPKGFSLRTWLTRGFFEHNIRRYSKSRRKAPIYWQLSTSSASYSVWLYYHRLSRDTFFKVLNDYVSPRVQHEERRLAALIQDAGPNPSARQRKEIDDNGSFVDELRVFSDEVGRIAPLWNPDLNDGVIINFAPLWRLVPQHRQWQKECKSCWDKLVAGEYDWAHLAMHLWPERVVPKCADDRSLAIAHDLEEVFWEETEDGKWTTRQVSEARGQELIRERTSPAVKAALGDLLSAPPPAGGRSRSRTRARTKSSAPKQKAQTLERKPAPPRAIPDTSTVDAVRDAIASADGGASRAEVIDATGITPSQWTATIRQLLDSGEVEMTGVKRGARFWPKGSQ